MQTFVYRRCSHSIYCIHIYKRNAFAKKANERTHSNATMFALFVIGRPIHPYRTSSYSLCPFLGGNYTLSPDCCFGASLRMWNCFDFQSRLLFCCLHLWNTFHCMAYNSIETCWVAFALNNMKEHLEHADLNPFATPSPYSMSIRILFKNHCLFCFSVFIFSALFLLVVFYSV